MFPNSGLVFSFYFSIPGSLTLALSTFFGLDDYWLWGTFLYIVRCFSSIHNFYLLDANSSDGPKMSSDLDKYPMLGVVKGAQNHP